MTTIKKDGKWIYIAGPYTNPDPVENSQRAIKVAEEWVERGYIPIIPHLSLMWHLVVAHPAQFWYDYTAEQMKRCDLVYRMLGESKGADEEVALARDLGIPVVFQQSIGDILVDVCEIRKAAMKACR